MPVIERLLAFLDSLAPSDIALGLALLSTLMLVIEERRLALLPLLAQYILVALLIGPRIYRPIALIWIGVGVAICLILYITARHIQQGLRGPAPSPKEEIPVWYASPAPALRAISLANMGPVFRLLVTALGGFLAYGLWRSYPLQGLPAELNLTGYWLISVGLLTTLTSVDPLRMGLGLLTFVNGFEAIYLFLEQSFVVIALLGIMDIVMALGVVTSAEGWLESFQAEVAR